MNGFSTAREVSQKAGVPEMVGGLIDRDCQPETWLLYNSWPHGTRQRTIGIDVVF
jgi:hypothetical protein